MPLSGFAHDVVRLLATEDMTKSEQQAREWRILVYSEYAQKTLLPILAKSQPDIIYERYSVLSYPGVELAKQLQIPLVLEVNAPLWQEKTKYRGLVLRRTAEELERKVLNAADALIVVSAALADYARQLKVPEDSINVLPNGVDRERFHRQG